MGRAVALRCSSLLISIKSPWRIFVLILCASFFLYLIYGWSSRSSLPSSVADYTVEDVPRDAKIILFWTKYFGEENHHLRDNLHNCPVSSCFLTNDRKYLRASSAVIFHGNEFDAQDLPGIRFPNQSYVIFLMESPPFTTINLKQYRNFFNLTWSFRRDADVFCRDYLDNVSPRPFVSREEGKRFLDAKHNKALWFVSNCYTPIDREGFVRELKKYYPVDILGKCGDTTGVCGFGNFICARKIVASYKFYLAFENSVCKDYVTEKPSQGLNYGTIPIVMGGANYSQTFAPKTHINTADFSSAKDLADYLHRLSSSMDLYAEFFEWRYHPELPLHPSVPEPAQSNMCRLCAILHDRNYRSQSAADVHKWFVEEGECQGGWGSRLWSGVKGMAG